MQRWPAQILTVIVYSTSLAWMLLLYKRRPELQIYFAPLIIWMLHTVIFYGFLVYRIWGHWTDLKPSMVMTWWSTAIRVQGGFAVI